MRRRQVVCSHVQVRVHLQVPGGQLAVQMIWLDMMTACLMSIVMLLQPAQCDKCEWSGVE